ncbi:MAG: ATP-binding protein, partial [Polyangiaceae bacterium]|nr:ATP-binding protein [Polyangiaceae bacterium]
EKWTNAGALEWEGIRGGAQEVTFCAGDGFAIEAVISFCPSGQFVDSVDREDGNAVLERPEGRACGDGTDKQRKAGTHCFILSYRLEVKQESPASFVVASERLFNVTTQQPIFETLLPADPSEQPSDPNYIKVRANTLRPDGVKLSDVLTVRVTRPFLSYASSPADLGPIQLVAMFSAAISLPTLGVLSVFRSMRFFQLLPNALRTPSTPGQVVLSDRGDNLSSALQAICATERKKAALLEWVRLLTPMDVVDFEFVNYAGNKVLVSIVDRNGNRISASSASEGTLRLLAMLAIFIGSEPPALCFFEEIETGFHPTRMYLLLELIENSVRNGQTQVIATTHSPHLLAFLSEQAIEDVLVSYRMEKQSSQHLKKLCDIDGDVRKLAAEGRLSELFSSGWLESTILFSEGSDEY